MIVIRCDRCGRESNPGNMKQVDVSIDFSPTTNHRHYCLPRNGGDTGCYAVVISAVNKALEEKV